MDIIRKLQEVLDCAVESGEELGCQLAVYRNGELLCSLSSGFTSVEKTHRVTEKTLFPVFSVGKGIVTTLIHILHEQGKIDYDAPVATYWPEYACNGKGETKVWHILTHRAAVHRFPEDFPYLDQFDWKKSCQALAGMAPLDTIGGMHHYHGGNYGVLVGHLAELAAGKPLSDLLREEIYTPLGIDGIFFGLPRERFEDTARIDNNEVQPWLLNFNSMETLGGLNPSTNGCMNAESLARFYASLIGTGLHGKRLLTQETVENATILRRIPEDVVTSRDWAKFGLGYVLCGPLGNVGRIFGQGGACGSEGFADKETGIAVGFTKNRESPNHPDHPIRNEISRILGLPERWW